MSMHLCPAFVTTTNFSKKKSKVNGKKKLQLLAHQQWVDSMTKGMKKDKKVLDKLWETEYTNSMVVDQSEYVSYGIGTGVGKKVEPKQYTGERKLLGIATMHKSNMVPVFADNKQVAIDIANMRRG